MSTLHKQNFDLKLELFHRRERQTVLEEQVELLEASKNQAEETNATLLLELEKRDKAVSEAVHMIISLETRIDLLLREREMLRQLESDKAFLSHFAQSPSTTLVSSTDATPQDDLLSSPSDRKQPSQTPSLISGHTESIEAFRNAGLVSTSSFLSLPKTNSKTDNDHDFISPSNSVLSESSFVSIYGQRDRDRDRDRDSSVPPDIPINPSRNGRIEVRGRRSTSSARDFTPSRPQRLESFSSRDAARNTGEGEELVSQLRKLERSDTTENHHNTNPQIISAENGADRSETVKPLKEQPLLRIKGHKEKPGRKILSDDCTTNNDHVFPPTPDTATSFVLNHGQTPIERSNAEFIASPSGHLALKRFPGERLDKVATNQWRFQDSALLSPQAPSFTAFTGRKQSSGVPLPDLHSPRLRRPRSADETTISRHKTDWDSESECDDAVSAVSSFDYWLKEGLRPSQGGAAQAVRPTASHTTGDRDAPDLFGFPSDENGWRSNDLFGSLGGTSYLGSNGPLAPALDAMGASLPSPEAGLFGSGLAGSSSPRPTGNNVAPPPAPYRKSSLNARTSAPGTPRTTHFNGKFQDTDAPKKRSFSGQVPGPKRSSELISQRSRSQTPTLPARTQHQQPEHPAQKRHYPPQASQQHQQAAASRPRSRGITSLFRRSMGAGPLPTSASVPAAESSFAPPLKRDSQAPQVGVPAWERRNDLASDRPSATPPPIMRKKATGEKFETENATQPRSITPTSTRVSARGSSMDVPTRGLGAGLNKVVASEDGGAPLSHTSIRKQPQEKETHIPPQSHGHGHGRKWFGLGRVTSLKHVAS